MSSFSIGEGAVDIIDAVLFFVLFCYKMIKAVKKMKRSSNVELPFTDKVITGVRILSAISILPLCALECIAASQSLNDVWLSSFLVAFILILIIELILIDFKKLVWNENRKSNNERLRAVAIAMHQGQSPQDAMTSLEARERLDSRKPPLRSKRSDQRDDISDTSDDPSDQVDR